MFVCLIWGIYGAWTQGKGSTKVNHNSGCAKGNNMLPYSLESEKTSKKFIKLMKLG